MLKSWIFTMYRTVCSWTKIQELKNPSPISQETFHNYNTLCSLLKVRNAFLLRATSQLGDTAHANTSHTSLTGWQASDPSDTQPVQFFHQPTAAQLLSTWGQSKGQWHHRWANGMMPGMLCLNQVWFSLMPDEFSRNSIMKAWAILFQASSSCFPEISALFGFPSFFLILQAQICLHNCASSLREHYMPENEEEEQTTTASQTLLSFFLPAPLLPPLSSSSSFLFFLIFWIKSLEVWNQYWNHSLQLTPRSQISEEMPWSSLPT